MNKNNNLEKIYSYMVDFLAKNGYIPSVREIGKAVGLSSTSTIFYYINKLEKMGRIKKSSNKNRAIAILSEEKLEVNNFVNIPLVGQIAAGSPILAIENIEDNFNLPSKLFKGGDLFMLKVKGDSMIETGINNGDYIVVKKQNYAENGEIVAAMWNDEATVKRFFKENGRIRLQPENPSFKPIIVDNVDILGKVVGLIRKI